MRILYVVHQLLPPKHVAGTEIYTTHLALEMQRRGHEVELFFTESYGDQPSYRLNRGEYQGLAYHEAVFNYEFATFESTYRNPRMEALFEQVLDATKPDLVHIQHLALHSIGYIDQIKARGLPLVYTLHEYLLMCPRDGQLLRPGLELCPGPEASACATCVDHMPPPAEAADFRRAISVRESEIRTRLDQVDQFISPSAFLRQKFIDVGWINADRIIHSDNGFFVDAFANVERTAGDKLRIGYIGTIADYKGVHLLIDAFAEIEAARAECRIWGDLGMFPDYGQRLVDMPKPDGLTLEGRFENRDVGKVLAQVDVLIIPSLWYENSPLTIHEAYLAGIPVIATNHGGMAELVTEGETGLLFRRGDADDLRRQIQRLLDDPDLLPSLVTERPKVKPIAEDGEAMELRYRQLLGS